MSRSTAYCSHLHGTPEQPSCVIPHESESGSVHVCMGCATTAVENWLRRGVKPESIPARVSFNGCPHRRDGKPVCGICYTAFAASLLLTHSFVRAKNGKSSESGRLHNTLHAFHRERGAWYFGLAPGPAPMAEMPAPANTSERAA